MFFIEVMKKISEILEQIAADLGLIYIRAININDLNQAIGAVKIDRPLLVYADLAEVQKPEILTNFTYYNTSVKIYILNINKTPDATARQIDDLLQPLFETALTVTDAVQKSVLTYSGADVIQDNLTAADSIELTDDVLSGWELMLTVPMIENAFYCE